ncbi:MAG: hypothetical protein H7832_13665 [Magnetococcus sp. DMHC-6]
MSKTLGMGAMILSILLIFIPVLGGYLIIVPALLAAFARGNGFAFGMVSIFLNLVNLFFLSPLLLWNAKGGMGMGDPWPLLAVITLATAQIVSGGTLFLMQKKLKSQ